jgi:triosephosphate isomerase (TIM)
LKTLIAGNWKMHKTVEESRQFARRLLSDLPDFPEREVVIAPPFTALHAVSEALRGSTIGLSAQNLHWEEEGAYTGEVSAHMLVDAGCKYVIIGHSERRAYFGERNDDINRKIKTALQRGLIPIFCVGETLDERESDQTFNLIRRQIKEGLNNISPDDISRLVIAYEPVWAIGTGKTATPDQAEEVHHFIRQLIDRIAGPEIAAEIRIIYGGSVNPDNIKDLMSRANVNGALVGGASLKTDSFLRIINY